MSWVIAAPEYVAAAANDLAGIGSTLNQANAAASAPISAVLPAGADEVSAGIAALFGAHAQAYQALSAQAALFHQQFVQLMGTGATHYADAEVANERPMQHTDALISDPALAATGRVPVGGAPGVGAGTGGAGWASGNEASSWAGQAGASGESAGVLGTGGTGAAGAEGAATDLGATGHTGGSLAGTGGMLYGVGAAGGLANSGGNGGESGFGGSGGYLFAQGLMDTLGVEATGSVPSVGLDGASGPVDGGVAGAREWLPGEGGAVGNGGNGGVLRPLPGFADGTGDSGLTVAAADAGVSGNSIVAADGRAQAAGVAASFGA
ncbi:PE family protein [Mycobacterium spongiae]|uniref:PE domain-containing protein n=1 Tax=Mycobacterium spongiae TaxID=886343 RepID=A0A975JZV7_9MYCO|nr:PE family protein [Mycobacterium spongiae]QUR68784.1 PE domain-containing protein [Mycobacterium spongiae]